MENQDPSCYKFHNHDNYHCTTSTVMENVNIHLSHIQNTSRQHYIVLNKFTVSTSNKVDMCKKKKKNCNPMLVP